MNVFKHVHNTNKLTEHPEVRRLHHELLMEVNRHLMEGNMQTNQQRYEATEFPVTQRFKSDDSFRTDSTVSGNSRLESDSSLSVNF